MAWTARVVIPAKTDIEEAVDLVMGMQIECGQDYAITERDKSLMLAKSSASCLLRGGAVGKLKYHSLEVVIQGECSDRYDPSPWHPRNSISISISQMPIGVDNAD